MLHCMKHALGRVPCLRPLRRYRHGQVSQGMRQIAGQLLYLGELRNCREKVLTAPSACRFPFDAILQLYGSCFLLFYSVTSLFRHFSFNFEVVVVGEGGGGGF